MMIMLKKSSVSKLLASGLMGMLQIDPETYGQNEQNRDIENICKLKTITKRTHILQDCEQRFGLKH